MSERGKPTIDEVLAERLAGLAGSELTALLLDVAARRQRALDAAEVARQYARDRFVRPCDLDQRRVAALDAHLLARIPPAYEAIELSPVAPLGTCSAVGLVHPNQVLPTFRGTEVVADCTNVLALECARRRSADVTVRLCTSHRLVRTALPLDPAYTQHFRLMTLARGGRDPGGRAFEREALIEQVGIWLRLLADLPDGLQVEPVELRVAWDGRHDEVVEALRAEVTVPLVRDDARFGRSRYYQGVAFKLLVRAPSGAVFELGDGGFVDWVAKLRSDRKERLLISAIGTELLLRRCAA